MRIGITIGGEQVSATVGSSAATRDLIAQLPVTVQMTDHGGVEKTGALPSPLSLDGQPDGADPDIGDVGYYAPGNDLVFYYGDQSYYPGIVIIGRLDGDAAGRIAAMSGPLTVTVEAVDDRVVWTPAVPDDPLRGGRGTDDSGLVLTPVEAFHLATPPAATARRVPVHDVVR